MFTELPLGYWSSRHTNLSTYHVSSPVVAFFVSYMHVHAPLYNVLFEVVYCCFPRNDIFLNMTFIGSHSFISLPSSMCVSAAFSELCESNQKKKKKKKKKKKN